MGSQTRRILILALPLCFACKAADRAPVGRNAGAKPAGPGAKPADSLALSGPAGLEIWFTLTRSARSGAGAPCVERGLQIRDRGRRIQVPLLYTGEPPALLNDSTMRAILWTDCHPMTPYLVDLRTGRPVPEREQRRKP
jgi:hypothetical protein